jgi:H+/gluconate symporter-like permease
VATHLVGWILTALAVSLGAPFWFDILKRFMNIRNAGVKPPTVEEKEKEKEKQKLAQPSARAAAAGEQA